MRGIHWALFLWLETAMIATVLGITWAAGRHCLKQVRETPQRRPESLFQFGRTVGGLPILALVPAFALWRAETSPAPHGFGAWLFAVAWTAHVVAWISMVWLAAPVYRAAGHEGVDRSSLFTGGLFVSGWFLLAPLLAGWAVIAFTFAEPFPESPGDPTGPLCFALGHVASAPIVWGVLRSRLSTTTEPPGAVHEAFLRLAGEGELPTVLVAQLRRAGLPDALASRDRRGKRIFVDARLIETFPADETTAILLHELGHHRLGHLRRREWISKIGLFLVIVVPYLLGWGHVAVFVVASWILRNVVLLPMCRRQEFAADRFAAERCGARVIGAALARLHRLHALPDEFKGARNEMTHPDLKQRLAELCVTPADIAATPT